MKKANVEHALTVYLEGRLQYHRTNFKLLMSNPRPIPEHTDFMSALEEELTKVAHYHELLEVLETV